MLESMTGFAEHIEISANFIIRIQLKSLNQKGFAVSLHLPNRYNSKSIEISRLLEESFIAGKISLRTQIKIIKAEKLLSAINWEELEAYSTTLKTIHKRLDLSGEIEIKTLLTFAKVSQEALFWEVSEAEWTTFQHALKIVIQKLLKDRLREGKKLLFIFKEKIEKILTHIDKIKIFLNERNASFKERVIKNVIKLKEDINYSQERMEQELLYYLDKYDISEEIDRLLAHTNHFREVLLSSSRQAKRNTLNFILQEMRREVTTLSNKSHHYSMQKEAISIKEIIEQIKEQLSNIV